MADIGPGSVVEGRYRIDRVLASGAEEAYRGVVLRGGRAVELVVVAPPVAQTLRRVILLSHPNLATLLEVVPRPAGYALAVFEAIEGTSLSDLLAVEPTLDPMRAAMIAAAIGEALTALHQRGGAHGLVRPASVVVEPDETRAAVLSYAPSPPPPSPFQSPERGVGPPSPADDVWALAATLHTMILGTPPPAAGYSSRSSVVRAGVNDLGLATLLANCLARRPEQRVTLVAPVRDALLGFRPAPTVATPSRPPSLWPPSDAIEAVPALRPAPSRTTPPAAAGAQAPFEDGRYDEAKPVADFPPATGPSDGEPALGAHPAGARPRGGQAQLRWGAVALAVVAAGALAAATLVRPGPRRDPGAAAGGEPRPRALGAEARAARGPAPPVAPSGTLATRGTAGGGEPLGDDDPHGGGAVPAASLPSEEEIAACVERVSPAGSFHEPPQVAWLCELSDPRAGYRRMKVAVVRGSAGRLTEAMSLWSRLNWYGMAAVAVLRGACCGEPRPFELPPTTGCDDTAAALDGLARAVAARQQLGPAVERYARSIGCQSAAGRSAYFHLEASLGGGEATTFQEFLDYVHKQR